VALDADALALEVIHKVGPGGDFLTQKHTLKHFRELWQPVLFDRRRFEEWVAGGSQPLGKRLQDKTIALIDGHEAEPLPAAVREEIDYILGQA
jgi:trimethylamine--corrinoid protein Co-methyltransferase